MEVSNVRQGVPSICYVEGCAQITFSSADLHQGNIGIAIGNISQIGKLCPEEPHHMQLKLLDFGRGRRSQRRTTFGI